FRNWPRILSGSIGTSGAPRTRKFQESVPKPINCWLHMPGREMSGNSKMPSNGRFRWERPPTFCPKTCQKRSERLRIWRILAKVYMSGNLPRFRNRSSREYSAKRAAIVRKPPGASVGIRIHSAVDARNSTWNEFQNPARLLRPERKARIGSSPSTKGLIMHIPSMDCTAPPATRKSSSKEVSFSQVNAILLVLGADVFKKIAVG